MNLFRLILFLFGVSILVFTIFFIFTGLDELWNEQKVWVYGIGIAGLLTCIGFSAVYVSLNIKKKVPTFLLVLTVIFLVTAIIGFLKS